MANRNSTATEPLSFLLLYRRPRRSKRANLYADRLALNAGPLADHSVGASTGAARVAESNWDALYDAAKGAYLS